MIVFQMLGRDATIQDLASLLSIVVSIGVIATWVWQHRVLTKTLKHLRERL